MNMTSLLHVPFLTYLKGKDDFCDVAFKVQKKQTKENGGQFIMFYEVGKVYSFTKEMKIEGKEEKGNEKRKKEKERELG